jgi:hypothetical protein
MARRELAAREEAAVIHFAKGFTLCLVNCGALYVMAYGPKGSGFGAFLIALLVNEAAVRRRP